MFFYMKNILNIIYCWLHTPLSTFSCAVLVLRCLNVYIAQVTEVIATGLFCHQLERSSVINLQSSSPYPLSVTGTSGTATNRLQQLYLWSLHSLLPTCGTARAEPHRLLYESTNTIWMFEHSSISTWILNSVCRRNTDGTQNTYCEPRCRMVVFGAGFSRCSRGRD